MGAVLRCSLDPIVVYTQVPEDPKALFRRCQAYEALNQVDLAYKDAREVHRLDANNKAIQPILQRLHKAFSDKVWLGFYNR
jgi:hypothetical protein